MKLHNFPKQFEKKLPMIDICILGLQGSRSLGMARTNDADYDIRGVYIEKNNKLFGLSKPRDLYESINSADNEMDLVLYEVQKFFNLCLKGNPNVLTLLFLPEYYILDDIGNQIIANRKLFLGERAIRAAYGGYAMSQILYLKRNHKFGNGKDTDRKIRKHIRHCFRLFDQGKELLITGNLTIPLKDPNKYIDLADNGTEKEWVDLFEKENEEFKNVKSCLPTEPDKYMVNELLLKIRGIYNV